MIMSTTSVGNMGISSMTTTSRLVMLKITVLSISPPVDALTDPETMSKHTVNRGSIRSSELSTSVRRMMLLVSASELRMYKCCVLYASEGSASAGKIDLMMTVKMSCTASAFAL